MRLAVCALAAFLLAAAPAQAATCKTAEQRVVVGAKVTLKLACKGVRAKTATISGKPTRGALGKLRAGRVLYTAKTAGRDVVRFTLRATNGRRYRGAIVIRVSARPVPVASPAPVAAPPAPAPVPDDGLPARLPAVPASASRAWVPTAYDTCPTAVHDRFSVVGPDGKRYPTWHPPTVTDPATGRTCTFGHEHGDDPKSSDIAAWASAHLAASGYEQFAGLPFGLAAEALNTYADSHPGTAKRSEDHVGYKVDVTNDVALLGDDGGALGITCDYLTVVHMGSHSPDALSNNAHELVYATRCTDGTQLVSTTLSRFGDPGFYERSCDPATRIKTTNHGYPEGGGARLIPDRECVERNVLVPAGRTTSFWALYEKWTSENALKTPDGATLASYDTGFGVFNPSRYANADNTIGRTLPLCWETAADGDRADGADCTLATGISAFDDPRSPFDGTRRDNYLAGTSVAGSGLVWTDPYGGNAQSTPFPGAVCQLVAGTATQNATTQVFGRNRTHDAEGVHAPN